MPVTSSLIMAGGQAASSTINNLFQAGLIKSQSEAIQIKSKLDVLSNQQQDLLNQELLQAKTDTERMQILTNAVAGIKQAQNTNASTANVYTAMLLLAAGIALLITAVIYKKYTAKTS